MLAIKSPKPSTKANLNKIDPMSVTIKAFRMSRRGVSKVWKTTLKMKMFRIEKIISRMYPVAHAMACFCPCRNQTSAQKADATSIQNDSRPRCVRSISGMCWRIIKSTAITAITTTTKKYHSYTTTDSPSSTNLVPKVRWSSSCSLLDNLG